MNFSYDTNFFIPYPKIENLETAGEDFPKDLSGLRMCVKEKLDGANIGLWLPRMGDAFAFTRKGQDARGFYSFAKDSEVLSSVLETMREKMNHVLSPEADGIYLWGEYYGKGIQNRIPYYGERNFRFYDILIRYHNNPHFSILPPYLFKHFLCDELRLAPEMLQDFFLLGREYDPMTISEIKENLKFPVHSDFSDASAEGFVLTFYRIGVDGFLRWKFKDPNFSEVKVRSTNAKMLSSQVQALREIFKSYMTENRALSILSKTTERKRLDLLVRDLVADAKEDFMQDHADEMQEIDPKDYKLVFKVGSLPFILIKNAVAK